MNVSVQFLPLPLLSMVAKTFRRTWVRLNALLFTSSFLLASVAPGIPIASAITVTCDGRTATIVGSGTINGTNGNDVIVGSEGNDFIDGKGGNDHICGRGGHDVIRGGTGNDDLFGEAGNDSLRGDGGGDNNVNGGAGIDHCGNEDGPGCEAGGGGEESRGIIVIEKDAEPDGPTDFSFSGDRGIGSFSLDDDANPTLSNQRSVQDTNQTYTVTEAETPGWTLTDLTCFDPDNATVTNLLTRKATIDLDNFEVVTCRFTNTLTDSDGDGVDDEDDNCPGTVNPGQEDNDDDGSGDACDADDDNDDVTDESDNCPLEQNADQADNDVDGLGDVCDDDDDNDGAVDEEDNCPITENSDQMDTDSDDFGDACDEDDDDDGIDDGSDNCPLAENEGQEDNDDDGAGDVCDEDDDNDGMTDDVDNCPFTASETQDDADGDGIGDVCDEDGDGDGINNDVDNCLYSPNADQRDIDADGLGDACDEDRDGDGVGDVIDNCGDTPNADQMDNDGDGSGDACDGDDDEDGIDDGSDNCPAIANPDQVDTDDDGTGDACDEDGSSSSSEESSSSEGSSSSEEGSSSSTEGSSSSEESSSEGSSSSEVSSSSEESSASSESSTSSESCACEEGLLWEIGSPEESQLDNPADEFNWPGAFGVFPEFDDPFVVGSSETGDFPWNSNFVRGYASDFDVDFSYEGSAATVLLTIGWAPGASGTERKELFLDGEDVGDVTRIGAGQSGWWSNMIRYEDTFTFALSPGEHTLNLQHTLGDGSVWDFVRLEIIDCSASCSSSSSEISSESSSLSSSSESSETSSSASEGSDGSSASSESSEESSSSSSASSLLILGSSGRARNPGQGAHRGAGTTDLASAIGVSLGLHGAIPPGGFGGNPSFLLSTAPGAFGGAERDFTPTEVQQRLICKAQRALTQHIDRLRSLSWVARMLSDALGLPHGIIERLLRDPSACIGIETPRAINYGTY